MPHNVRPAFIAPLQQEGQTDIDLLYPRASSVFEQRRAIVDGRQRKMVVTDIDRITVMKVPKTETIVFLELAAQPGIRSLNLCVGSDTPSADHTRINEKVVVTSHLHLHQQRDVQITGIEFRLLQPDVLCLILIIRNRHPILDLQRHILFEPEIIELDSQTGNQPDVFALQQRIIDWIERNTDRLGTLGEKLGAAGRFMWVRLVISPL